MDDLTRLHTQNTASRNWLTTNRKWNFVFWLAMSLVWSLKSTFHLNLLSGIVFSISLILIMLTIANKTRIVKGNKLKNNNDTLIDKGQMNSFNVMILTIASIFFTGVIFDKLKIGDGFLQEFIFCIGMFSGVSLYFIIKNYPISILFNPLFWRTESISGRISPTDNASSRNTHNNLPNYATDPSYRSLSVNSHHRR